MYYWTNPSIVLHPKDTERLIVHSKVAIEDLENSNVFVEHDEEIILAADEVNWLGHLQEHMVGIELFQGIKRSFGW